MYINEHYHPRTGKASEQLAAFPAALRTRLLARVDSAALVAALQTFTISRLVLLIVTYLSVAFQVSIAGHGALKSASLWDAWYRWDARWYVQVAASGYQWHDMRHYASVAFFPAYPILIKLLLLFAPISAKLAAIVVANASFLLALYFLHRLIRDEFGREVATRTVLYLSFFPTALFFFAGYSESPFLLWSVLSIAAMRRRQWAWAGLWGCLASGTRSMGLALMVPFAVEYWEAYGPSWRNRGRGLWILLIPLGWGLFALYLALRFGHPLLFDQIQLAWHRTTTWPWVGLVATVHDISLSHIASYGSAHNVIELLATLGFAALIVAGWRRLPRSFTLYAGVALLMVLVNPGALDHYYLPLRSTSRFCLALFPCFITLALLGRHAVVDRVVMTLGPALLALCTVVFLQGGWIA